MTRKRKPAHLGLYLISLAIASCLVAGAALANPTGPTVVNGTAAVLQNGNLLQITNTPNAIINWQSFSIGVNEITRFIQQSQASSVLNRVTIQNPSSILGALQSNGRVFLINPNGIVFGAGSVIDTAGLVASSLNLSNADFLSGRLNFTATPDAGSVVNQGNINTSAGGSVYFVGPAVTNSGIITSPKGEVVLAAGNSVELVNPGTPNLRVEITAPDNHAINLGQISAESGRVGIYAGLINHSGTIRADSAEVGVDGRIVLKATKAVTLEAGSVLSATGTNGANGGFIETSAEKVKIAESATITTVAQNGATGTWLIDPTDYTIAASGGDITGSQLSTNLGGGNITIVSSGGGTAGSGDVNVNDAVSWSANTLTLTAARDVNINDVMTASGTSALALNPGTANGADSAVAGGTVKTGFNTDGTFRGRVDFGERSGTGFLTINGNAYTVINSLGAAGSVTGTDLQGMGGGRFALGSDIDASATSAWNSNGSGGYYGFAPSGGGFGASFTGAFDGLGHTITGLTIARPSENYVGLFGYVAGATPIRNVGLVNVSVLGGYVSDTSSGFGVGGLAGSLGAGGVSTISNSYSTGSVSGNGFVGGLVGRNNSGAITGSYSTARVTGSQSIVGGLVGFNSTLSSISSSYSAGNVSGASHVGGLVGENDNTISNSYSTGNVSATWNHVQAIGGGLVGSNWGIITNSYSTGSASGAGRVGGLVGDNAAGGWGRIFNSYWDTQASGNLAGIGSGTLTGATGLTTAQMKQQASFSGWDFTNTWRIEEGTSYPTLRVFWAPPPPPTINTWLGLLDSYWTTVGNWSFGHVPTATETVDIPDVAGTAFVQMADGTYTVKNITSAEPFKLTGTGTAFTLTQAGSFNAGLDLGAGTNLTSQGTLSLSSYTLGAGAKINLTQSGAGVLAIGGVPYIVINSLGAAGSATGIDLQGMSGNLAGRYALGSDIDASATFYWSLGTGFAPVGDAATKFTGTLDGLGHAITDLTIDKPSNAFVGLFGYTSTVASIRNVGLRNGNVSGAGPIVSVGGLAGFNEGTIVNSYNTGNVSGSGEFANVGGLAGGSSGTIGNSYNTGGVSGTYGVGGLVGDQTGNVINSYNTGNVSGTGEFSSVGGLAGSSWTGATISNSYNAGGVSGDRDVGGLAGYSRGSISSSYNTGAVSGNNDVGGLAGSSIGSISNSYNTGSVSGNDDVGGLAGTSTGNISNSYNTGSVSGNDGVGGLAGTSAGNISNSYNTGNVSGNIGVAGLASASLGEISNSFNTGSVSGTTYIGGLVGYSEGSISNSYNTGSVSSAGDNVGGLVGDNWATITNSYNTGSVSGKNYVGGLVGFNEESGVIGESYSSGRVTGDNIGNYSSLGGVVLNYFVGGLVGANTSIAVDGMLGTVYTFAEIRNSYWNTQTSGQSTSSGGGAGLTTAQMKQQASFAGWNFSTVWGIDEGSSFPYLRVNEQIPHPSAPIFATTNPAAAAGIGVTNQVVAGLSTLGQFFNQVPATTNNETSGQGETSLGENLKLICNK